MKIIVLRSGNKHNMNRCKTTLEDFPGGNKQKGKADMLEEERRGRILEI